MPPAHPTETHGKWVPLSVSQWQAILTGDAADLAHGLQAAAERDDVQAQAMLGQLLLDGRGLAKDTQQAFHWFVTAARHGHAMAMNMAGRCLQHGWGVATDASAAARWFHQAASKELDWGMYNYAVVLSSGNGVTQDHAQALRWFRRAAELGHAKSLNLVGRYYEEGLAVTANKAMAFAYYRQSAHAGDFRGQYSYATMLIERGSVIEAIAWLKKIPATATPAFLQHILAALDLSPHACVRAASRDLRAVGLSAH